MGAWYLDTTRIIITDMDEADKLISAKLNPLGGGTVTHVWGWEEPPIELKTYVVGSGDYSALRAMVRDGTTHTLLGSGFVNPEWNTNITVFVDGIKWASLNTVCQTMRPDLPTNSRVYAASITLTTEEYPDT